MIQKTPYYILLLLYTCLSTVSLHAQFCGLQVSDPAPPGFFETASLSARDSEIDTVGLAVWVIRNSFPVDDLFDQLNASLEWVNEKYEAAGLHFFICEWTVEDGVSGFNPTLLDELNDTRFQDHRINVYLVQHLSINGLPFSGIGKFPWTLSRKDRYMAILQSATSYPSLLAHELGHYYGLYHTHDISEGREFVARSNCHTAGDLCCDTPADPGLGYHNMIGCNYAGNSQDPQGYFYYPLTDYIMSYAPLECTDRFSAEQYARIRMTRDNVYSLMANRCDDLPDISLAIDPMLPELDFLDTLSIPVQINHSFSEDADVDVTVTIPGSNGTVGLTLAVDTVRLFADQPTSTHMVRTLLPPGLSDGMKLLQVKVDGNRQHIESDERNNETLLQMVIDNARFGDALLFPNPASGQISLYFRHEKAFGALTIEMADMLGRPVYEAEAAHWVSPYFTTLPVEHLSSGKYVIVLRDRNGERLEVLSFVKI